MVHAAGKPSGYSLSMMNRTGEAASARTGRSTAERPFHSVSSSTTTMVKCC